jgi:hypothetical protein
MPSSLLGAADWDHNAPVTFALGWVTLFLAHLAIGGTAVFAVRRYQRVEPAWSWPKSMGAYFLLGLLVTGVSLIPIVGRFAALIVSLVGLKRFFGLDLLSTFIVAFCLGLLFFILGVVLSRQLGVELLDLGE